ncbi:Forkhead box protein F1 [Cichlidogyrus casuarinus]|uniref:Forkhead box protein F1 n=1 Tax=Cichlidogyrus casuarinus TaxID=1844966 RepID=A0ABD2QNM3_9PLAT
MENKFQGANTNVSFGAIDPASLRSFAMMLQQVSEHMLQNQTQLPTSVQLQHESKRPEFTYIQLIQMAIKTSEEGKCTLNEIYKYLQGNWEFFRGSYTGWKNSIRHTLSVNDLFVKIPKDINRQGKTHYWTLNPNAMGLGGIKRLRKQSEVLPPLRQIDDPSLKYEAEMNHSNEMMLEQQNWFNTMLLATMAKRQSNDSGTADMELDYNGIIMEAEAKLDSIEEQEMACDLSVKH